MNQHPAICGKCDASLRESSYNSDKPGACPQCYTPVRAYVFPAWERVDSPPPVFSDSELGEASCFNHENKKAAAICDDCGKFVCSLCLISYAARQLCAGCVTAAKQGNASLKKSAKRPDVQAFWMALTGLLIPIFGVAFAVISLYLVIRYWKFDETYVAYSKWRYVVAGLVSGLVLIGTVGLFGAEVFL